MVQQSESESRKLLSRLQAVMAEPVEGQERLTDHASDRRFHGHRGVLDLPSARRRHAGALRHQGLAPEAVHQTRMRIGEGLVGRVARRRAPSEHRQCARPSGAFATCPRRGRSGIPPSSACRSSGWASGWAFWSCSRRKAREFSGDEVYALEVVAMVVAEMAELGAFPARARPCGSATAQAMFRGGCAQEGTAMGHVWLHEPRVVVTNPVADDPEVELQRLRGGGAAADRRGPDADARLCGRRRTARGAGGLPHVRQSRGWMRRMEEDIARGLSAEAAVEKEQSTARARMEHGAGRLSARPAA
jgi:phosphotransferase system enzyme I (PtsP)